MARSINEIQDSILSAKESASSLQTLEVLTENEKQNLDSLTSTSRVSVWRLFVYIVAVAIWTVEQLLDVFRVEIDEKIALSRVGTVDWYITEAKKFQFGFSFIEGKYNNEGIAENILINSRIVKQVAIEELEGRLNIKVVKEDNTGALVALTQTELSAFQQYMNKAKIFGTRLNIISRPADLIKLELDIYYDAQVMMNTGQRLDGVGDKPVEDTIEAFTRSLEFNGELILQKLVDALQGIEGVKIADLKTLEAKFGQNTYTSVDVRHKPDSGHYLLDLAESTINYIDYND